MDFSKPKLSLILIFGAAIFGLGEVASSPKSPSPPGTPANFSPTNLPITSQLTEKDREILAKREKNSASLNEVEQHVASLQANRAEFLHAWFEVEAKLIEKERKEKVGALERLIADTEAKLKWSNAELQKLDPTRTTVEIRTALQIKINAEKSKLQAVQKQIQIRKMEWEAVKKKYP